MSQHQRSVSSHTKDESRLPDWASTFAFVADGLYESGFLDQLSRRIRVQREGGYTTVDVVLFLLAYFTAELRGGFREFSASCVPYTKQMGAMGGRKRLPTQASVSRYLKAVPDECCSDVDTMSWLLVEATGATEVINRPEMATFDTKGGQWHCFDVDGTLTMLRHRALPVMESMLMPDANRRAEPEFASPGYSGRKRGEVQLCRLLVQHAGSGVWVALACHPGSDDLAASVALASESVERVTDLTEIRKERCILRFDGFYGSWQTIRACVGRSLRYVVRWKWYQLLHDRRVMECMEQGRWIRVPDSGSGPKRYALDVGFLMSESQAKTEPNADVLRTRVVVTRHRNNVDRGVGEVIGGWRYEVFVTNLPDGAWPAAEVVNCYYGRVGQENRFGQEDRELELDRIFSYSLPGQRLVNLFGLFWWNLETVKGWLQVCTDPETTKRPPKILRQPQILDEHQEETPSDLMLELDKIDWVAALSHVDNWSWEPLLGLHCPAGHATPLKRILFQGERSHAIFRARRKQCGSCSFRPVCTKSVRANFRKELHIPVPLHLAPIIAALKKQRSPSVGFSPTSVKSTTRSVRWQPPQPRAAGQYDIAGPILVPTVLRRSFRKTCQQFEYHVSVDASPSQGRPPHLVLTPAQRQHRRKTWQERHNWNALNAQTTVKIEIHIPRHLKTRTSTNSLAA